jgi:hypothetical protein
MQPLVARDGGSAGRGGGGDGGTDRGAVLGSGGAKEVAQPGGDLAVGRGGGGGVVSEPWHWDRGVWCGPEWLELEEVVCHAGAGILLEFQPKPQLGSSTVVASCPWNADKSGRSEGRQGRQHAYLVLRPIERALRVASGRGEAWTSMAASGRGSAGWRCTGWPGQRPGRGGGGRCRAGAHVVSDMLSVFLALSRGCGDPKNRITSCTDLFCISATENLLICSQKHP